MDTFSSTVSTFKVPPIPQPNHEFYSFKRTPYYATPYRTPQPQPHVSSTSSNSLLVPKTNKAFSHKFCSTSLPFSSSKTSPHLKHPSSPIFHESPATGYAAAVIDVAQSSKSLHLVHRDVQRLLRFLPSGLPEEVKGQVIRQLVNEQGKFQLHRHAVALLKMVVKKNKVGIVHQVLEEFERIYDELCGTQVVLVSSATKLGQDGALGIANRVQQLSGAIRVKVTNMVQHRHSPSCAM